MTIREATTLLKRKRFKDCKTDDERKEFGRAKSLLRETGNLHSQFPRRFLR